LIETVVCANDVNLLISADLACVYKDMKSGFNFVTLFP